MKKASKKYNLKIIEPEIVEEWHPKKNKFLKPIDVLPASNIKVWWLCNKGHEWLASIHGRYNGNSCPYCIDNE